MRDENTQKLFRELPQYTLNHRSDTFIHQNDVAAFTLQTPDKNSKVMALIFSLAGLYLHIEKG